MASQATTQEEYIASLPEDRKAMISSIRKVLLKNLPKGFEEGISYGMLGYCVPHSLYPNGYHCNPKLPLPFISLGSTKSHIALHHLGLYGSSALLDWFVAEWAKYSTEKLDMGKGCVRFKKAEDVQLKLIEELAKKMTPQQWIEAYEKAFRSK